MSLFNVNAEPLIQKPLPQLPCGPACALLAGIHPLGCWGLQFNPMNTLTKTPWQIALAQWIAKTDAIHARAKVINTRQHERGWKLAATVGIPHDGCCLHNASIDDKMTGWCAGNPHRLAIAKKASALVNDWRAARAAERMTSKAWNELMHPLGAPKL